MSAERVVLDAQFLQGRLHLQQLRVLLLQVKDFLPHLWVLQILVLLSLRLDLVPGLLQGNGSGVADADPREADHQTNG